jgi:HEPN domain-containing protein
MKQLTREWLNAAGDDLTTIEKILDNEVLTNIAAFHAQQTIEKSFKAVMEEFEIGFIKTHNLQTLFLKIADHLALEVNELILSELDRLYIDARYPGELGLMPFGKPSIGEAKDYYNQALQIKNQVEKILGEA